MVRYWYLMIIVFVKVLLKFFHANYRVLGLSHGQEKSRNQEKLGKTKKNVKSQEKLSKNGNF